MTAWQVPWVETSALVSVITTSLFTSSKYYFPGQPQLLVRLGVLNFLLPHLNAQCYSPSQQPLFRLCSEFKGHVCVCVCVQKCVHVYARAHRCVHVYMCVHAHVGVCMCICVCMWGCVHVMLAYTYVCTHSVCVCMHMWVCASVYIHVRVCACNACIYLCVHTWHVHT